MGKKILIITASPRTDSKTKKMAEAFAEGAREGGHEVTVFDVGSKQLHGCNGCNACWSKGNACIIEDDFLPLSHLLESCEVALVATPLYWSTFPAQLKAVIDRVYAYGGTGGPRPLAVKESYLFVCGGAPAITKFYEPLIMAYKMNTEYLGITDRGIVRTGESEADSTLEHCRELGRNV